MLGIVMDRGGWRFLHAHAQNRALPLDVRALRLRMRETGIGGCWAGEFWCCWMQCGVGRAAQDDGLGTVQALNEYVRRERGTESLKYL
jgi:hypothetical protein